MVPVSNGTSVEKSETDSVTVLPQVVVAEMLGNVSDQRLEMHMLLLAGTNEVKCTSRKFMNS